MNVRRITKNFLILTLFILILANIANAGLQVGSGGLSKNLSSGITVQTACKDTDGGINYNQAGTVYNNDIKYTDLCSGNYVKYEYYCDQNNKVQIAKPYLCPNGCRDGACIQKCEIGGYRCEKNSLGNYTGYAQKCYNSTQGWTNVQYCQNGCDGLTGQCQINNPTCTDSDGGINYDVKGKTSGGHEDLCFINKNWATGVQYDIKGLYEMYCCNLGSGIQTCTNITSCPNGCQNGACVNANNNTNTTTTPKNSTCTDSDGGKNYSVKGTLKVGPNGIYSTPISLIDQCIGNGQGLEEYFCISPTEFSLVSRKCSKGCNKGVCIGTALRPSCNDTDGINYFISGGAYNEFGGGNSDTCTGNVLSEGVCEANDSQYGHGTTSITFICPNGCKNGACVNVNNNTNTTTQACTDTDGGTNYDIKGTINATNLPGTIKIDDGESVHQINNNFAEDICKGYEIIEGTLSALDEYYCGTDGLAHVKEQRCLYGCNNGACISIQLTCQKNYLTKWHNGYKCNTNACGNNTLVKCNSKSITSSFFGKIFGQKSYQETCQETYTTTCQETPTCDKGYINIKKEQCRN